jgi:hypothetical protein
MTSWFVCDMDDGVLRREPSRTAALAWWLAHNDTVRVLARHSLGPGDYHYRVGATFDDSAGAWIMREDRMAVGGWDREQAPLYPHDGALAHEAVPRPTVTPE